MSDVYLNLKIRIVFFLEIETAFCHILNRLLKTTTALQKCQANCKYSEIPLPTIQVFLVDIFALIFCQFLKVWLVMVVFG